MKKNNILFILTFVTAVAFMSCKDDPPSGPTASLGNNTVTKYAAIGNSLTAGYQSGGLYESAQMYSYPNLIAQQLTKAGAALGKFEQPIWSDPGSYGPDIRTATRLEILNLTGPVIAPKGVPPGQTNLTLTRPYDNLGIPGAVLGDFLEETNDFIAKSTARKNPFFAHVLRNPAYGKSVYQQLRAISPKPEIITFWLGNNDVLGFATSGGVLINSGAIISFEPK